MVSGFLIAALVLTDNIGIKTAHNEKVLAKAYKYKLSRRNNN
jgi:hypothetical protein